MKTSLLLLVTILGAGQLAAQTSPPNHTVRTNAPSFTGEYRLIMPAQNPYELRRDGVIYDGLAIELFEAKNPVKLLVPFKPDQPSPTAADRVWEQGKSDRPGLNIFSIKF
jgi:hypothetical protein